MSLDVPDNTTYKRQIDIQIEAIEMTFPIRNRTSMKPGNARFECLALEAERECEAFLVYNPSRRASTFIEIAHYGRGTYVARGYFTSDQGRTRVATVISSPTQL